MLQIIQLNSLSKCFEFTSHFFLTDRPGPCIEIFNIIWSHDAESIFRVLKMSKRKRGRHTGSKLHISRQRKGKNRDTIFLNGEAYKCDNLDILFCLSFDQVWNKLVVIRFIDKSNSFVKKVMNYLCFCRHQKNVFTI